MYANLRITRLTVAALLVLTSSFGGCLWGIPITATVDDYAVSPDGSQIAIVVFSGREKSGGSEVQLYNEGVWESVPLPFDMNSGRLRFLDNERLQVLAFEEPGPTKISTRFIVDTRTHTYAEFESWPGEVVDYIEYNENAIIAKAPQRENRYDLFWANDTAITDYRFWRLRDLEIVGDALYFSKASYIEREGTHDPFRPEDNPDYETRILMMNLTTMHVDFVFTTKQEGDAGVEQTLQRLCLEGQKLYMMDTSLEDLESALYSFEPGTNSLERVAELPFGAVAPCVRGPHVYFIKVTGSHRMPEELWRMDLQSGVEVRFAP